jgi:hypothetical protein
VGRLLAAALLLPLLAACRAPEPGVDGPFLGGTRAAWVAARGSPATRPLGEVFGDNQLVTFAPSRGTQRAVRIDLLLGHEQGYDRAGVPLAQARELARPLHPPDGRTTPTRPDIGLSLELYHSDLLMAAFDPRAFGGAEPGGYMQVVDRGGPTTDRVVLVVGDYP